MVDFAGRSHVHAAADLWPVAATAPHCNVPSNCIRIAEQWYITAEAMAMAMATVFAIH